MFKLNKLVGLIFGKIEFWAPFPAEGHQNLSEFQMELKMVSKRPERILVNLELLFEPVILAIFFKNSVHALGGPYVPPTLYRVKLQCTWGPQMFHQ